MVSQPSTGVGDRGALSYCSAHPRPWPSRWATGFGSSFPCCRSASRTWARLAAEVAARVTARFEASAWVDLASLSDPALVAELVAATLGYREEGGRSAVQTMVHRLCECDTFVILDNCEHLVDACAEVAETLLKGCPSVCILATSREALGVPGEQAWLVPPLSLPARTTAAEVLGSEAGRLFLERARAVLPAFSLDDANAPAVAQIG